MVDVVERVVELFDSTCHKQFESMGCEIFPLPQYDASLASQHESEPVCATIECVSEDLVIRLIVQASKGFLIKTMPLIGGQRIELRSFQEDWCLEIANRFLGRLKNKLVSHGCSLQMGLPSLCADVKQTQLQHQLNLSAKRMFQVTNGPVSGPDIEMVECTLFVELKCPDLRIEDYEDEDEDWFDESELQHL
jgi:hypothetical protein